MAERATEREASAPEAEDDRKPDSPTDITKPSWVYIAKKTMREFTSDQCTDLAAALTYYGILAIFPALLAFVSLLGVVGDAQQTTAALLDLVSGIVPSGMVDAVREPIERLTSSPAAGFALVTGIVGALWSASGFVGAFGRAMNRIYAIEEGRPFWKLRPITLAVTVMAVLLAVVAALLLVVSGPIAEQIGSAIGLGSTALLVWNIAKWPVLLGIVILIVATLYYATPNVQQPKFRWMSMGALVAILVWIVASAGFTLYVANFSSYNETYGSIGGVIVFLLWVWISNLALLFGAELDAEIERGRQLQAGIAAEQTIQLPPRDTSASDKKAEQHAADVRQGLRLRRMHRDDSYDTESDSGSEEKDPASEKSESEKTK